MTENHVNQVYLPFGKSALGIALSRPLDTLHVEPFVHLHPTDPLTFRYLLNLGCLRSYCPYLYKYLTGSLFETVCLLSLNVFSLQRFLWSDIFEYVSPQLMHSILIEHCFLWSQVLENV